MPHASSCTFLCFPKSPPKPPLCPSMPSPMPQCVLLFPHNPPLCQLLWPLCTFQCPMPICHCMPSLWPTAPLPILRSLCPMALFLLLWPLLCPYVPMPCNMTQYSTLIKLHTIVNHKWFIAKPHLHSSPPQAITLQYCIKSFFNSHSLKFCYAPPPPQEYM